MKRYLFFIATILIMLFFLFYFSCTQNFLYGIGDDQDVENPRISVSTPSDASIVGSNFTIIGTARDDVELHNIKISTGDNGINYNTSIKGRKKWSITVDTTNFIDGKYRFTITVSDKSGKKAREYLNVTLDKTGPDILLTSPQTEGRSTLSNIQGTTDFTFEISDTNLVKETSENNRYEIIDKSSGTIVATGAPVKDGTSWQVQDIVSNNFTEGATYTLRVTFEDFVGNLSTWEINVTFLHVSDIPVLTIISPDPDAVTTPVVGSRLNLSGYVIDDVDRIKEVQYTIASLNISGTITNLNQDEIDTSKYTFFKSIDLGTNSGSCYVNVLAIDEGNNPSAEKEAKFLIDSTKPELEILDSGSDPVGITPVNAFLLNTNFTVQVQCTINPDTVTYKITQGGTNTGWINMTSYGDPSDYTYQATIDIDAVDGLLSLGFIEGAIDLELKAISGAEVSTSLNRTFYFDVTAPSITVISHNDDDHVNGAVTISGSVDDNLGFLDDVLQTYNSIDGWQDANGVEDWSYVVSTNSPSIETKFSVSQGTTKTETFQVRVADRAGNIATTSFDLVIDPDQDVPTIILLAPDPAQSGLKVSGSLSILATIDDDDYPSQSMSASIDVQDSVGTSISGFPKNFNNSPNLSAIVDTTSLTDGATYTIKVNGSAFNSKTATEVTCDFVVDSQMPEINVTAPATGSFMTNSINFTGTVKDENNCTLNLVYTDASSTVQTRSVTITPSTPEPPKQVWTFDCTLNGSGADIGLGTPDISWGNDEWGNNPHIFTLRVTDETGSMAYSYIMINLDNNNPTGSITYPDEDHIIDIGSESINLEIRGGMNDTPSQGTAYPLTFNMIELQLWDNGAWKSDIKTFESGGTGMSGIPENFIYTWNHSGEPDSDDYSIRFYVKDSTGTSEIMAQEVPIIKNANPPEVEDITIVGGEKSYYKDTITFNVDAMDRGTLLGGNGVDKIELLINGGVEYTNEHDEYSELEVDDDVFNLDTTSYSNGNNEVSFRVTDRSGYTHELSKGILVFDNEDPVISNIQYKTLGYGGTITEYTTYLGFSVDVTDSYSLAGDNPQFTMGTSQGGTEIMNLTYFNSMSWNGQDEYTATFDNYKYVFEQPGPIWIRVISTDAAGNIEEADFSISEGTYPSLDFDASDGDYVSDNLDSNPGDSNTEITGTVASDADMLWIQVDSGAESQITGFGSGAFTKTYTNASLSNASHTFRVRTSKDGLQNIITKTFIVDNESPDVVVNNEVTEKTNQGHVSDDYEDISGIVIFSGTYFDNNLSDISIAQADLEINIDGRGWEDIPSGNIVQFPSVWNWTYEWDSEETLTDIVGSISIQVRCDDRAGNSDTDNESKTAVPYITSLDSDNPTDHPVLDVSFYQDSQWDNHENRRYSVAQGTELVINGYNLKQGSTTPTLTLGGNSLTVTSSDNHQVKATIPTNDSTGKTGSLDITVGTEDSTDVKLYVWKFHRVGNAYDTYDSRDFDITLKDDGYAFVTFARDHQTTYYTGAPNDYCTYRMQEAASYNMTDNNAYNNYGQVDPMWFTANALFNDRTYMASDLDEWTGMDNMIIKPTTLADTTEYSGATGGGGNGTHTAISTSDGKPCDELNTVKSGDMIIRETSLNDGYLYLSMYDDDSRETSPTPRIYLLSTTITNYALSSSVTARLVTTANTPELYNAVALTASGYPSVVYYTSGNNQLNISYNTSSYTPTTFTHNTELADGGKYCDVIISSSDVVNISYQDENYNLAFTAMNTVADGSPSEITLETMADEGITGFNTSICLDGNNKPYISYINNSELNTTSALHLAKYNGTGIDEDDLITPADWEYMKIPSEVSVNSSNTVIKWDSSNDWPVIAYKGNNYIYIARLVQ